jgi:hypothetical protein
MGEEGGQGGKTEKTEKTEKMNLRREDVDIGSPLRKQVCEP